MPLKIAHLYADLLNLYGDKGNILALTRRLEWRGIPFELEEISINETKKIYKEHHLFFIGGGQDKQQELIAKDFKKRQNELRDCVEAGAVILSICGGYQLLGKTYQTSEAEEIEGLDILKVSTQAMPRAKNAKQDRLIGNVSAELLLERQSPIGLNTLVGFENHSGRTYILDSNHTKPLAKIIHGFGNNGEDGFEGAYYKNVLGTYLHGSLLPKNPHLTDELLWRALSYAGLKLDFKALDDSLETQAHQKALKY